MKIKRFCSAILAGVFAFSLIACNGNGGNTNVPDTPTPTGEMDVDVTNPEGDAEGDGEEIAEDPNDLYDGKVIIYDKFEEDDEHVWGKYENGGSFDLLYENGEMVADIKAVGSLEYAVQIFRDKHQLNMGGVYEVSFDVRSDVERDMKWRFQINGGDYHDYFEQVDVIGPETQTIVAEFTMEDATDPAPRFCFNLGKYDSMTEKPGPHKVYFDNFKLVLKDASNAQAVEPLPDSIAVKVNQVGYKPDDLKKVVITSDKAVSDFSICKVSDNSVVYSGKFDSKAIESPSGDGTAYVGNFNDFKEAGEYYIKVDGFENSYNFVIDETVYDDITKAAVLMLYLQRCGCETDEEIAGDFAHESCHDSKARIYGTDTFIDVTGGWHDAGDYGRYVVAGAKTVEDLFLTYEDSESSRGDDYGIPESGNGVPDILDEARYELEFMLKMQNSEGGVYHKVTCAVFPENFVRPEEEKEELIVCPVSETATGDFAAVMAKAYMIYKEYDPAFANKCLEASKKAYAYYTEHRYDNRNGFTNPDGVVTGEYPDKRNSDEGLFAAVELFIATGDSSYADDIKEFSTSTIMTGLGWADVGTYALMEYVRADCEKDSEVNDLFSDMILDMAKESLTNSQADPYSSPMILYPWGSNMTIGNTGMLYKMAYDMTGDEIYNEYSRYQLDYLLGINPLGYCYVTGFGTLSPEHVHHRPSAAVGESMPGMLVGGPNSAPSDPYAATVLADRLGGMCYIDNDSAFSVNEITIYWNSPFIYMLELYK